jgi:hypothetical protein
MHLLVHNGVFSFSFEIDILYEVHTLLCTRRLVSFTYFVSKALPGLFCTVPSNGVIVEQP